MYLFTFLNNEKPIKAVLEQPNKAVVLPSPGFSFYEKVRTRSAHQLLKSYLTVST